MAGIESFSVLKEDEGAGGGWQSVVIIASGSQGELTGLGRYKARV